MSELWTVFSTRSNVSSHEPRNHYSVVYVVLKMMKKEMCEFNENDNLSKYQNYLKRTQRHIAKFYF